MPHRRRSTVSLVLLLGVFALLFCSANSTSTIDNNKPKYDSFYDPILGIDIGNTNCHVAISSGRYPEHSDGFIQLRSMPACVTFTASGVLIGNDTKVFNVDDQRNMICGVKELLGQKWSDPKLQAYIKNLPYEVVGVDDQPMIKIDINDETRFVSPQDVYGMLLGRLRDTAEKFLERNITNAVVTVPAYYNDRQRQAVKDSGQTVNLSVLRIINEPTAASIAYGLDLDASMEQIILVYDIGATATDVAVLEVDMGVFEIFGTTTANVGGNDFNERVLNRFLATFEEHHGLDAKSDFRAVDKLWTAVEQAKRDVSANFSSHIAIDDFHNGLSYNADLTRSKFEDLNRDLFSKAFKPVKQNPGLTVADLKFNTSQIDHVVLVGGSAHIPKIVNSLEEYFGKTIYRGVNPDHAVVLGAAIQGAILSGIEDDDFPCCVEVNPLSVGIETTGGVFSKIILRNSPIPTRKTQNFTTASGDQTSMLVRVFEGERVFTKYNKLLGELVLSGIRRAPKGEAVIEVSFEYDYGNLKVCAEDKETGHNATFITEDTRYNTRGGYENLDQLVFEADEYAEEDHALLESIIATIGIHNSVAAQGDSPGVNEPQRDEL